MSSLSIFTVAVFLVAVITPVSSYVGKSKLFWLYLSSKKASYEAAAKDCTDMGARLAVLDTVEKDAEAKRLISEYNEPNANWWVGAIEFDPGNQKPRVFYWASQTRVKDESWCPGQPHHEDEHCALLEYRAEYQCLHDYPCISEHYYICERVC